MVVNSDGQAHSLRRPHPDEFPYSPQLSTPRSPSFSPRVVDCSQPATTDGLHQANVAGERAVLTRIEVIIPYIPIEHRPSCLLVKSFKDQDYQTTNPSLDTTHQSSSRSSSSTLREVAALSASLAIQPALDDLTHLGSFTTQSLKPEAQSSQEASKVRKTHARFSESITHGPGPDWVADSKSEPKNPLSEWIADSESEPKNPLSEWIADSESEPENPLSEWIADCESEPENPLSEWIVTGKGESKDHLAPERTIDCQIQWEELREPKMTVSAVRHLLEQNRMYVESPEAAQRGRELIKKATAIMDERRDSSMDIGRAIKIIETVHFYATKNEKTLLINVWSLLLNETRFFKTEDEALSHAEEQAAIRWIQRAWTKDDNLWTKWDAEFHAQTPPKISTTGDPALDILLAGVPRVANPKPDLCIGFDKQAFEDRVIAVLDKFTSSLTAEQYISFFLLEAKGADGSPDECTNQCCRGGAALVKLCRDFHKAMNVWLQDAKGAKGAKDAKDATVYPYPDMASFAFSIALTRRSATMYVHWAEVTGVEHKNNYKTEVWQQSKLRTYELDNADHLTELRRNIDNILDWGIRTRKRKIVDLCDKYIGHYSTMSATDRGTVAKRAKEAVEGPLIKRQKMNP
ncbi:hypothetical protein XANCAGTX0491_010011 [Xanthoria calcicola]